MTFSKHNLCVGLEGSTPEDKTMLSHSDLTTGEFREALHILSVGIFRIVCLHVSSSFRNKRSASSKIPTKSFEGLTIPPLERAEMKLDEWFVDFMI
jgi:hypothetical protein